MLKDNLPTLDDIEQKFQNIYSTFEGMFDHSEITTKITTKGSELIGKSLRASWRTSSGTYISLDYSFEDYDIRAWLYISP